MKYIGAIVFFFTSIFGTGAMIGAALCGGAGRAVTILTFASLAGLFLCGAAIKKEEEE